MKIRLEFDTDDLSVYSKNEIFSDLMYHKKLTEEEIIRYERLSEMYAKDARDEMDELFENCEYLKKHEIKEI